MKKFLDELIQENYKLEEIATIMEVSYQAIQNYRKRDSYPTVKNLKKLAEHLNISIDYILGYKITKQPLFEE